MFEGRFPETEGDDLWLRRHVSHHNGLGKPDRLCVSGGLDLHGRGLSSAEPRKEAPTGKLVIEHW